MLDPVSELSENRFRNIHRVLCDEIDSDTLASDKTHDLLDLVDKSFRSLVEEHMSLIKEEDKLRKVHVTYFRKLGIELGKKPQEECRIKLRLQHELVCSKDIHHALALFALKKVVYVERRLCKELVRTLVFKGKQCSLYGSDTLGRYVAVCRCILLSILGDIIQHGAEVLHVDKQKSSVVGNPENYVKYSLLCLIELKKTGKELRTHIGHGSPHRMALLSVYVEESHRAASELRRSDSELGTSLLYEAAHRTCLADTGKVTFHIGHEARHSSLAETFRKNLKSHGLSCSGCSGNETMAVRHLSAD